MKLSYTKFVFIILLFGYFSTLAQSNSNTVIKINEKTGEYKITYKSLNWDFIGSTNHRLNNLQKIYGKDSIGKFEEIRFNWKDAILYQGSIKHYFNKPIILFSLILPNGSHMHPEPFPSFTSFPNNMFTFSYGNDDFAPYSFKLNETSTPWLFFNNKKNAFIISPASDFIVSKLNGNSDKKIISELNEEVKNLPKNFSHKTILVFGNGIKNTWDEWGKALRIIYGRKIPANDADPVLKYFGYWTDNGANYYYNYDTTIGYSQTLLKVKKTYKQEGIPLGYMQLDSWWYEKSIYDPSGKPDADNKNPNLPKGRWNRYGGLMSYNADPFLFPKDLTGFQNDINLPLVTHNRWIDPHSPYQGRYHISGFAAVDPKFWHHIISYLKSAGVVCYEQDWLNYIYEKSPEMSKDINIGNAFTDGMANACKQAGLSMQYCMAMPRFFLQGLKYNNLTTIRTSGDRFEPNKWENFLYTSQLAHECGIYPWCDVFMSSETGNMILSVLSDGPVGTGDIIGKEDKTNILMACRKDGVLVKPDVPILPIDNDYLNDAEDKQLPMISYTYTKHNNVTTGYVFAFTIDSSGNREINFTPSQLGLASKVAVFDPLTKKINIIEKDKSFKDELPKQLYTYYILAPVNNSGIAFFGDSGKFVATGKKRIADIEDNNNSLKIKVLFAKDETSVQLEGYSGNPVTSDKGEIKYNDKMHTYKLSLPSNGEEEVTVNIESKK